MVTKKKAVNGNGNGHVEEVDFVEVEAPQGYDLSAKHPLWMADDGVAIKGLLLGTAQLPSAIATQPHWNVLVFKLTGPTKVHETVGGEQVTRIAKAGETVIATMTAALLRLEPAALDPRRCFEVYLKPGGKEKTKAGFNARVFDSMIVGRAFGRTAENTLPSMPSAKLLGPVSDDGGGEELPF